MVGTAATGQSQVKVAPELVARTSLQRTGQLCEEGREGTYCPIDSFIQRTILPAGSLTLGGRCVQMHEADDQRSPGVDRAIDEASFVELVCTRRRMSASGTAPRPEDRDQLCYSQPVEQPVGSPEVVPLHVAVLLNQEIGHTFPGRGYEPASGYIKAPPGTSRQLSSSSTPQVLSQLARLRMRSPTHNRPSFIAPPSTRMWSTCIATSGTSVPLRSEMCSRLTASSTPAPDSGSRGSLRDQV